MKNHSPILIVAAVPQELNSFLKERNGKLPSPEPSPWKGEGRVRVVNEDVHILLTGMGYAQTLKAVRRFLSADRYRGVVAAGFSGGTRPGLRVGDLVAPSEVIWASTGERFLPAEFLKVVPGASSVGPFVTVKDPVADPLAKAKVGDRYGAIAVDLETAAVARAAGETKVPWMALRAILDPVEVPLGFRSWGTALRAMASPSRWRALKQFLGSVHLASVSLGGGLKNLLEEEEKDGA